MNILSVFEENVQKKSYPALTKDISVDVTVIGGGITGITAAFLLSKENKTVALIEAMELGKGATGSSTGNLYSTIGNKGLHAIQSKFDKETLSKVVYARAEAVNFIESRVNDFNIDCDFKRIPWNLFTTSEENRDFIKDEYEAAKDAGLNATQGVTFPLNIKEGFKVDQQAQFNPYKYVIGLAENISQNCQIYENTKFIDVEEEDGVAIVHTTGGKITCKDVVMATHTPKGNYQVHMMMDVQREYAVAVKLKGDYPSDGTYWNQVGSEHYSMRTYDSAKGKVLMVLGQTHKVGQKENNRECFKNLEEYLDANFDVESIEYKWAAQQYKPADTLPYIGKTTDKTNVYIATGFAADGLTFGTLAAMIISDQILGIENRWAKTFDVQRHTPLASATEVLKAGADVMKEYFKDLPFIGDVDKFTDVGTNEARIVEYEGEKCGAYRDGNGQLHIVSAVCTHMKCIVNWNSAEKSWDCPCHGSRFTPEGTVIEGPAITDLQKLNKPRS